MLFAISAVAMLSAATSAQPSFADFTRSASLIYITEQVQFFRERRDARANRDKYKVHYTWSRQILNQDLHEDAWIDSEICPRVREILSSMEAIQMPRLAPIGDALPVDDGIYYSLSAPTTFSNGMVTISSNVGSPLATWVDHAITVLAPCLPKVVRPG